MLARVCGSLMEGCNVWGSPLRFVQVPGLGCHAKTVQNPAKTFKNKNQVVALPRLRWPQGCRMSSPKEGAKWSVINLNMLHGFPDFPSSGYFHVIRGKARIKIPLWFGGARYHFMARNTSERFQEWNGMQRKWYEHVRVISGSQSLLAQPWSWVFVSGGNVATARTCSVPRRKFRRELPLDPHATQAPAAPAKPPVRAAST